MKRLPLSLLALAVGAGAAWAQDDLKVAVGARGVGETFVAELGQNAGIFKKYGLALEILYTQGGGETQQGGISNSGQIDVGWAGAPFGVDMVGPERRASSPRRPTIPRSIARPSG